MVAVHLQSRAHPEVAVWCGTYHMPCAFMQPKLMAMHAALAVQHLQRLARPSSAPCVLGGDWNIKPWDPAYKLLTTGRMDHALDAHYPAAPAGDAWTPNLPCAMRSGYAEAHGREPDFTNCAQARDEPVFIGCLDYVFVSPHVRVLGAPPLPPMPQAATPQPTAAEPSDHLLVSVALGLPLRPDPSLGDVYHPGEAAAAAEMAAAEMAAAAGGKGGEKGCGKQQHPRSGAVWKRGERQSRADANETFKVAKREELEAFAAQPNAAALDFAPSLNSYERMMVHVSAAGFELAHLP